jgi:hypothetical protein
MKQLINRILGRIINTTDRSSNNEPLVKLGQGSNERELGPDAGLIDLFGHTKKGQKK